MKVIVVQVDDLTYDRLNQLALARGISLSDHVRLQLGLEAVLKMTHDEMAKRVHDLTVSKLKKEAEGGRGTPYRYDLKVYKSVGKRTRIYWRTKPVTEYDAMMKGVPDKVGMWELVISKEVKGPPRGMPSEEYRGDGYYRVSEERKHYYKRRGLYKAINSLCRRYRQPLLYREGAKMVPSQNVAQGAPSP